MSNTSATGGFLLPAASPAPLEGQDFEDFLQQIFVGLTGISGTLVRPSWQEEPPDLPEADVDWFAFKIAEWDPDTYAVEQHDSSGVSNLKRHETVRITLSFYGPRASYYMALLRDGLQIEQNRTIFTQNAMGLVDTERAVAVPSIVKDKWYNRVDMPMTMRRLILRSYPVLNIASFNGILYNELYAVPINVTQ
jgi:hypothetical protein